MKILTHTLYIVLILIGLSSCEMREEILGHTDKVETGSLELTVDAKTPHETKAGISTADFPVTIVSMANENYEVAKQFPAVSEMPQSVLLPVGKYYVLSHSKGDIAKRMEVPYYKGGTNLDILKDVVSSANVVCRMLNSRIEIKYSAEFIAKFKSWNITLNDGSETALSIKNTDATKPIYWFFGEKGAETVTLHIRATTNEGNSILMPPYVFRKTDAGYADINNPNFVGGDALIINLKPGKESDPTSGKVTDISVTLNVLFENHDELVEIPVEDKVVEPDAPVVPDQPETEGPTLTCDAFNTGVEYSIEAGNMPQTEISVSTPKGLKSMQVTIEGGNEGFSAVMNDMNFVNRELVDDTELESLLGGVGVTLQMPKANDRDYKFPIGQFYMLMNIYGSTVDSEGEENPDGKDAHVFKIRVEDQQGKVVNAELSVKIKK